MIRLFFFFFFFPTYENEDHGQYVRIEQLCRNNIYFEQIFVIWQRIVRWEQIFISLTGKGGYDGDDGDDDAFAKIERFDFCNLIENDSGQISIFFFLFFFNGDRKWTDHYYLRNRDRTILKKKKNYFCNLTWIVRFCKNWTTCFV